MMKKFGRWLYGDRSYYLAHIVIGTFFMVCIGVFIHFGLEKPLDIVLEVFRMIQLRCPLHCSVFS